VSRERIIWARGPAIATTVKVTGASPVTVAVAVCLPVNVPSVHTTVAAPFASVTDNGELRVPDDVLQATATPFRLMHAVQVEALGVRDLDGQRLREVDSYFGRAERIARHEHDVRRWSGLRTRCIAARDHLSDNCDSEERSQSGNEPHFSRG
jgi:hypothetical protein